MKKTFRDKLKYEIILRDFPEKNRSSRCQSDGSQAVIKPQNPLRILYGLNSQFWGVIQYKRRAVEEPKLVLCSCFCTFCHKKHAILCIFHGIYQLYFTNTGINVIYYTFRIIINGQIQP